MAAGLPVVVSDWDGYRYTVRDGQDGFLIPTLGSPGGAPGELLANFHSMELASYQTYVGAVAQHTAVHVQRAAAAIAQLADDEKLRRSMGKTAQQRAQTMFAWPAVVRQYTDLFDELAERRRQVDPGVAGVGAPMQPNRGEPFADFQHFASGVLHPEQILRLADDVGASDLQTRLQVTLNRQYPGVRCNNEVAQNLLQRLDAAGSAGLSVHQLLAEFSGEREAYLKTTLVWLAKMGLVDWLPQDDGRSH
jgi:hypothetical protein